MTQVREAASLSGEGLAGISAVFKRQVADDLHPAAALAVYLNGQLAVDLVGGTADPDTGALTGPQTLFRAFSSGKPLGAACLWVLHEQGKVNWDDPVARHWPEFGLHGKDRITVRQVLTHTAGLPTVPAVLADPASYADWGRCVAAMENASLEYEPGDRIRYHGVTYGWLVGELVARISRVPFPDFFMQAVARPLGLHDSYFALPGLEHTGRVARLVSMEGFEDPVTVRNMNAPASYFIAQPGFSLMTSARDLAKFYAVLADGGRSDGLSWLSPDTVADVTSRHASSIDIDSGRYLEWGLGVMLPTEWPNRWGSLQGSRAYGHTGLASSMGWADESSGLAVAFIATGLQTAEVHWQRLETISRAVRAAVA